MDDAPGQITKGTLAAAECIEVDESYAEACV